MLSGRPELDILLAVMGVVGGGVSRAHLTSCRSYFGRPGWEENKGQEA